MIMNRQGNHSEQTGSTLIGAIVSTLILSIGMAALYSLYINSKLSSSHSQHVSTALAYARDKIETLRFNHGNLGNESGSEQLQASEIVYQRSWQISGNPGQNFHLVNVSMHWLDSSGNHNISLNTVISGSTTGNNPFLDE